MRDTLGGRTSGYNAIRWLRINHGGSHARRTTRKQARERLFNTILAAVDRIIPENESKPLRGSTFADWEDHTDAFKQAVIPTILEERAALEANAQVDRQQLGRCPFCGSDSVRLRTDPLAPPSSPPNWADSNWRSFSLATWSMPLPVGDISKTCGWPRQLQAAFVTPSTNTMPSINSCSFSLPFNFRQVFWALAASLNAMARPAFLDPGPLVR